jgi:hypothetical protein
MTLAVALDVVFPFVAQAQQSDIQQKLSNPVASLTLIPIQTNYDSKIGEQDGYKITTNIQPVVPFKLDNQWSLIVRTIVPIIQQHNIATGSGDQFGLGDSLQSFFFSPRSVDGFTWGAGPALLWRTGTDELLTSGKWAAGPTAVALQQTGPWTIGLLTNHIWSFAGDEDRRDISNTYLQPFLAYAAEGGITYSLNTETNYNWITHEWSVPIDAQISKLTKIGDQPVSILGGLRYWVDGPANGPHDFGGRVQLTFILP